MTTATGVTTVETGFAFPALTKRERERFSRMGRIGAHVAHATYGTEHMTRNAHKGFRERFVRQARELAGAGASEQEIAQRAEALLQAHMARLALARWTKRTHSTTQSTPAPQKDTPSTAIEDASGSATPSIPEGHQQNQPTPEDCGALAAF